MSVWAVVVARVRRDPKSRLAPVLDDDQRRALATAMLADVLRVCTSPAAPLDSVLAVTDSPAAASLAESFCALAVPDTGGDMNLAARAGLHAVQQHGATTAIVLPGDIPLLHTSDLEGLLAAAAPGQARAVVIGASRDGQGTNALLLRPPDVIQPAFGPPSVERHVQLAHDAGAHTRVLADLGLALDVDTPADLCLLADLPVGPHTSDFLARSGDLKALTRI